MNEPPRSVFITGASGFIGAAIAAHYRSLGSIVRGVDRVADPSLGVVAGDIRDDASFSSAIAGADLVVHTAAIVSFEGDPRRFWDVNVLGTRRVLDAAIRAGSRRFVQLSSVTAFGFDFPDGVDERWPVQPNGSPYVDTKVASEQVVLQAHAAGEIACTVIRPGDVYGPRSRPWTILPVEMIRSGRMLLPEGGRGIFSPVYIDNIVDGIALAASSPAGAGQVFTISDGIGVTTADFFGRYATLLGARPIRTLPTSVAASLAAAAARVEKLLGQSSEMNRSSALYLARRGTYSIEKARRMLGYLPCVSLDEGFERTARWLRDQGMIAPR